MVRRSSAKALFPSSNLGVASKTPPPGPPDAREANRRGAFVLGALLAAIVAVAIAISVRIYTQLDSAAVLERTLIAAQADLDQLVQAQVEQQNEVRAYLATGEGGSLGEYAGDETKFAANLQQFDRALRRLDDPQTISIVAEMRALHEAWKSGVADPLIRDRTAKNIRARSLLGTIDVEQLLGDSGRVSRLLQTRLAATQAELKLRIDEALFGGIASILVFGFVSIVFVTSRVAMQGEIDRERSIVETLQGAFRNDTGTLPGARVGTAYLSAERDSAVGGDLYDVRRLDASRGLVLVADVSGKGIPAAVNTAFVRYSIAALARNSHDPAVLLEQFDGMFHETVVDPNLFVVAFVGVLDERRILTYASAGHAGAYLRRGAAVRQLEVTGPIVGLDASSQYESRTVALEPGDILVLATDGLSESRDRDGAFLGDEGAMAMLAASQEREPQAIADELVANIRQLGTGELADDLALLVLAIDGPA